VLCSLTSGDLGGRTAVLRVSGSRCGDSFELVARLPATTPARIGAKADIVQRVLRDAVAIGPDFSMPDGEVV
jgi:hypothetical protein